MIRSAVVQLSAVEAALPIAAARGFSLSAYGTGQAWPVTVNVREASGREAKILALEGRWYALGAAVSYAAAFLPAGSSPASYILDLGETREDAVLPATPAPPVDQVPLLELLAEWPAGAQMANTWERTRPAGATAVQLIIGLTDTFGPSGLTGGVHLLSVDGVWRFAAQLGLPVGNAFLAGFNTISELGTLQLSSSPTLSNKIAGWRYSMGPTDRIRVVLTGGLTTSNAGSVTRLLLGWT